MEAAFVTSFLARVAYDEYNLSTVCCVQTVFSFLIFNYFSCFLVFGFYKNKRDA